MIDVTTVGLEAVDFARDQQSFATLANGGIRMVPTGLATDFTPPPGVVLAQVDRVTGCRVSVWCASDDVVQEAFREGSVVSEGCDATVREGLPRILGWFESLFI